jgi:hypothetical protein
VGLYVEGEDGRKICRRVVLDRYLDGREDRNGCEEGEELCDVCGGVEEDIEGEDSEEIDGGVIKEEIEGEDSEEIDGGVIKEEIEGEDSEEIDGGVVKEEIEVEREEARWRFRQQE